MNEVDISVNYVGVNTSTWAELWCLKFRQEREVSVLREEVSLTGIDWYCCNRVSWDDCVLFSRDDSFHMGMIFCEDLDRCLEIAILYLHNSPFEVQAGAEVSKGIPSNQDSCLEVWDDMGLDGKS